MKNPPPLGSSSSDARQPIEGGFFKVNSPLAPVGIAQEAIEKYAVAVSKDSNLLSKIQATVPKLGKRIGRILEELELEGDIIER